MSTKPVTNKTAKPELIPVVPDVARETVDQYVTACNAVSEAVKTGKDALLASLLPQVKPLADDGRNLVKTLGVYKDDKGNTRDAAIRAGEKTLLPLVHNARNQLLQVVKDKLGNPDKLTESLIVRAKSTSFNQFRTYRHANR